MSFFSPRHPFFRSIMFRDSLGWGVLRDRIQLERIFGFPRPNPYHHYCYFVSFCPLQISDPPSTTITLLNALIKKVTQKKKKKSANMDANSSARGWWPTCFPTCEASILRRCFHQTLLRDRCWWACPPLSTTFADHAWDPHPQVISDQPQNIVFSIYIWSLHALSHHWKPASRRDNKFFVHVAVWKNIC